MRYPRYLTFLDAFGVVGLISSVVFVLLPQANRPQDHLDSLWGNISSEFLGIWISVRFIEWIIRSHETATKVRVRVVRNMRYVENMFHQVLDFRRPYHLIQLHRELNWIRSRLDQRERHLKPDERQDVAVFYQLVNELVAVLPTRDAAERASDQRAFVEIDDTPRLYQMVKAVEVARYKAEANILEETNEDEGM